MLKYRVVGSYDENAGLVESILKDRNLDEDKVKGLFEVDKEEVLHYNLLENVHLGVGLVQKHLENGSKIGVLLDNDCDGLTSATQLYLYMKKICPQVEIVMYYNNGKVHGLNDSLEIKKEDIDLLIVPDAGTSNCDQHDKIRAMGIEILVIDHHKLEEDWRETDIVLINNQVSPNYPNKSIAGAGVTWKFLKAMDDAYGVDFANDFVDLAGLGCLADVMDCTVEDTRYLMNEAIKVENIKNPLLKKIINEKILKYDKLNLKTLAWNVAPLINGVFRVGTIEDKKTMFLGFITEDIETIDKAYKSMGSCKSKQDRNKKKAILEVEKYIEQNNLGEYPIMVIDSTKIWEYDDGAMNGVVCNNISEKYNRPVIIVGGKSDVIRGSVRNTNLDMSTNFRNWCIKSGLFEMASGHDNAFGVKIRKENIERIMEAGKENFGVPKDSGKTYLVDGELDFKTLAKGDVLDVGELKWLYATNLKEPTFVLKNVAISSGKIEKRGARGSVLGFNINGFSFYKTFLSKDFYSKITLEEERESKFGGMDLLIDLVCTFGVNEWNGKKLPQIEIIDCHSRKAPVFSIQDLF